MIKIVFFQIKKNSDKLLRIANTALIHFENKKHLLFLTPDEKALKFVDDLLWSEPKFSFLPHAVSEENSDDLIVVTQKLLNLNRSQHIFNLCPLPIFDLPCSVIYEFDDLTDKNRSLISKNKFQKYQERGFLIESR